LHHHCLVGLGVCWCVELDCRVALIAAGLRYTLPDQEPGVMKCVVCSSSKLCDAIPACTVTTVRFSCRPSLHRLRRSPTRPQPMTNSGSVRHEQTDPHGVEPSRLCLAHHDLFSVVRIRRIVPCRAHPVDVAAFVNNVPVFIRESISRQVNRLVADWAMRCRVVKRHDG
jgi:hypothetical protein